jgi:hypothetical protein
MQQTFTLSAAADLLERDRATLKRALRNVKPDEIGKTRGRGREQWGMATIVAALERNSDGGASRKSSSHGSSNNHVTDDDWQDPRIVKAFNNFEAALDKLQAMSSLEQRRAFAIATLGPIIEYNNDHLRQWGLENNPGEDELVGYRAETFWRLCIHLVGNLCEWTREQARENLEKEIA